jgi:hypothetical protein
MPKYIAESQYIASIYPGMLERITLYHGDDPDVNSARAKVYWIPPFVKGYGAKPKTLEVSDCFENVLDPMGSTETATKAWQSKPVPYQDIVRNLLQRWAGGMIGLPSGASPGIMAIKGTVPHDDEIKELYRMQNTYYEYNFQQGERRARENDWKGITPDMKDAAIWLGVDRAWSTPGTSANMVACSECKQQIPVDARICHHCGTRLKAMPPEIAALNGAIIEPEIPIVGQQAGPIAPPLKQPEPQQSAA